MTDDQAPGLQMRPGADARIDQLLGNLRTEVAAAGPHQAAVNLGHQLADQEAAEIRGLLVAALLRLA